MSAARKNCLWYDQCGSDRCQRCDYYDSPEREEELDEIYYQNILEESVRDYETVIQEYSDRGFCI